MAADTSISEICIIFSPCLHLTLPKNEKFHLAQHFSLLAEVSHDDAKMRERREISPGSQRVFYHACACISLTTSDVFVTCDTTHRTGLRAKLQEISRTPQSRKFEESEDAR